MRFFVELAQMLATSGLDRKRHLEDGLRLQEIDRLKSEFMSTVTHELREPLSAMIGFTELVLTQESSTVSRADREHLTYALTAANHLATQINRILDAAKLQAGRIVFHPDRIKVADLVSTVVDASEPLLQAKGLTCCLDGDPEVWIESDRSLLTQVLTDLLDNAIKFTERGRIDVRYQRANGGVALSVTDTGIGIAARDQEDIFDSFKQVDATSRRRYLGTGVGLFLVRKYVELLGGRVAVESEPGEGSRFTIDLPQSVSRASRPTAMAEIE